MDGEQLNATARLARHTILRILVSFPIACFTGTLITDTAYALTADMMWADFSAWLLAAGILMSVLAAIGGIFDVVANRRARSQRRVWPVVSGSLLVLILALFDNLVHTRDAWTSVVPAGLGLSAVTVVFMLITAWFGSAIPYRQFLDGQYPGVRQ